MDHISIANHRHCSSSDDCKQIKSEIGTIKLQCEFVIGINVHFLEKFAWCFALAIYCIYDKQS